MSRQLAPPHSCEATVSTIPSIARRRRFRPAMTLAIFASGLLMALAWLIGGRVSWRFLSRRRERTLGLLGGMMPVIMLGVIVLYAIVIY